MTAQRHFCELSSTEAEARFREVFLAQLLDDGFSDEDARRLIFQTPAHFHRPPTDEKGLDLLDSFREHYQRQLPYAWYFEGLRCDTAPTEQASETLTRPITLVVLPGIFAEFIDQLPFQSALDDSESSDVRKWRSSLAEVQDETYSLLDREVQPRSLDQLVKIGSLDQGEHTLCNIIVLESEGGSLESLGNPVDNVAVFRRRLEKIFAAIDDESDIFLIGYSRGLPLALELISTIHRESAAGNLSPGDRRWYERLRGVVGLGGVFYGAKFAQDVLDGHAGTISELVKRMNETADCLTTIPDDTDIKGRATIVRKNLATWSGLMKWLSGSANKDVTMGRPFLGNDLNKIFQKERKLRQKQKLSRRANTSGILGLVRSFLHRTFKIEGNVARYNKNILAYRELVSAVTEGLISLTPETRDTWWRTHPLPDGLLLLSLTGSMPDVSLHEYQSPLSAFEGYGPKTSDYDVALRSSYYETTASEGTQINDSQVSHFASRYWPQMYPGHNLTHYYLGILGTHHWGMAFPFAIEDDHGNSFPRSTLLRSIATFIVSLERDSATA